MMRLPLPDLCDAYPADVQVAEPMFNNYGGNDCFSGEIATVTCFEDNSLIATRVEEPGRGRVLVVDAGGSLRCAVLGDNLAQKALDNGWSGLIINGCIRDVDIIETLPIGVAALATHPLKSVKRNVGRVDETVAFAGLQWVPGHYVYADNNGVLVSAKALTLPV
ncbi:MAG: regulator of ribonuclease activity A [Candidatus Azotimanducaceae bacterium]|jgi:regulator of ribonuclease activity A|tara:strand:+ start:2574 stop:3065 length:492 start_codon:yes stop_codon:yes gene_type:complete